MPEFVTQLLPRLPEIFRAAGRFALPALGLGIALACGLRLAKGTPQAPPEVYLFSVQYREKLPLPREEASVGRSKRCDVVLNIQTVSRFHAVIAKRREGWVVIDTGSKGGTKLDGLPVEHRAPLSHGQTLTFGTAQYRFVDPEEERRGETY